MTPEKNGYKAGFNPYWKNLFYCKRNDFKPHKCYKPVFYNTYCGAKFHKLVSNLLVVWYHVFKVQFIKLVNCFGIAFGINIFSFP